MEMPPPTPEEGALLRLLLDGATDDEAARVLRCSRRTVQRRLAGAMEKLGASSRLQAGYLLARTGWLEEPERAQTRHG